MAEIEADKKAASDAKWKKPDTAYLDPATNKFDIALLTGG